MPAVCVQGVPGSHRLPGVRHHHHHEHAPRSQLPPPIPREELPAHGLGRSHRHGGARMLRVQRALPAQARLGQRRAVRGAHRGGGTRALVALSVPAVPARLLPRMRCLHPGAAAPVSRLYIVDLYTPIASLGGCFQRHLRASTWESGARKHSHDVVTWAHWPTRPRIPLRGARGRMPRTWIGCSASGWTDSHPINCCLQRAGHI